MKKLAIIFTSMFIAFTVNAQSTGTSSTKEKKAEKTTVSRSGSSKSSGSTATRSSSGSSSRSSATRSSSGNSSRSSATRSSSGNSSRSSATRTSSGSSSRSSATRSSSGSSSRSSAERSESPSRSSSTRTGTTTRTTTRKVNTGDNNRESRSSSTVNSQRSTNSSTRTVETGSRNDRSVRGTSSTYRPRTTTVHAEKRKVYTTYMPNRVYRSHTNIHYTQRPVEYRRIHNPYRTPRRVNIYWNVHMYNEYRSWYPHFDLWYYPYGYRIHTISAYDAYNYVGEIARIYGKVYEVWYEGQTDQFFLYFGGPYPYNDFTIIMDGHDARRFSRNPVRFFTQRHVEVTGLVSSFDGKPEILVKKKKQIRPY